jgi:hypothetical protein
MKPRATMSEFKNASIREAADDRPQLGKLFPCGKPELRPSEETTYEASPEPFGRFLKVSEGYGNPQKPSEGLPEKNLRQKYQANFTRITPAFQLVKK